jgi:hypothetical protein
MRLKWVISGILAVVITASCIGQYIEESSKERRSEIQSYRWNVNANGFDGILEYTVVNNRVIGTFSYWHANQTESNPIEGYQVGRNIVFYRHSTANQIWIGWIGDSSFEGNGDRYIAGTLSHLGENSYPWHGIQE